MPSLEALIETEFPAPYPATPIIPLNHAGVAPWPRRTARAVAALSEAMYRSGGADPASGPETEDGARGLAADLIGAEPADIAFLKNTSEGLSVVAHGLPWQPGDSVVTTDEEFPSNRIVWESLRDRGVEVREAALGAATDPEAALFARVDEGTRLIAVSSVQYATGRRMDLGRIGAFCREHELVFCVDAIQSLGALAFDIRTVGADAVVAGCHKWLLSPPGVALFYTSADLRARLRLHQYGWHMVEERGDFDRRAWTIAKDARRFECGTLNTLGLAGLRASLQILAEAGMAAVETRVLQSAARLRERILVSGKLRLLNPLPPSRQSGIVVFDRPGRDTLALHEALQKKGVLCARRGGGIRFSAHFHTPAAVLDTAVALAETL